MQRVSAATKPAIFKRFRPHYMADNVMDIDFAQLKREGVEYVALDIDSTLVNYGEISLLPATQKYLRQQVDTGVIKQLLIATNRRKRNVSAMATSINATVVQAGRISRKPRRSYFRTVIKQLDCQPEAIAMVGDKLFIDVYGGNRVGMKTILVKRLGKDSLFERFIPFRALEYAIIKYFFKLST